VKIHVPGIVAVGCAADAMSNPRSGRFIPDQSENGLRERSTSMGTPSLIHQDPICVTSTSPDNQMQVEVTIDHARSKRSRFITLFQAAMKSWTNFPCASELP
jgi:hypothetical protein